MHAPLDPGKLDQMSDPHVAPPDRWVDLPRRVGSAILLAALAVFALWFGGLAWDVTCSVIGIGIAFEWLELCKMPPRRLPGALMIAIFGLIWGAMMFGFAPPLLVLGIYAAMIGLMVARPWLGIGLAYTGLSVWAMIWLRHGPYGFGDLLFLLPVVWATDVGAYTTGRVFGGPKLAPHISPGKTWAGALGGALAASLVGAAIAGGLAGDPTRAALVAAICSAASQLGDLGESWAKRHFGVKDSGNLIPGHGGLFDRLDGTMAASFVAVVLALLAGPGAYLWR